ncbi:MAG: DUF4040 domain-containing protein, partial [Candidatus Hydrogenedentes bacterium]|nr:DUF4040 domain-containing protein [Candidatus Hydrogenedentota bacterium]
MPAAHDNSDKRMPREAAGYCFALLPFSLLLVLLALLPRVAAGGTISWVWDWIPSLGIALGVYLDGLAMAFALLITGIGTLVFLYANAYFHGKPGRTRFLTWMSLFMLSMLGVVTASNLITIYICWELTSITSFMLIGFDHHRKEARAAALQALLVTVIGGFAMMAGFILLGQVAGTYEVRDLLSLNAPLQDHPWYGAMVGLILLGAFTKSAQFPFHFWLANAMQAPTPASAYLHSSTMVKAGVFLIARLNPVLGGTPIWQYTLVTAGCATMLVSSYLAVRNRELKPVLAYTTVNALGSFVAAIGLGSKIAIQAMIVYLLVHALYKAALFMVAGAIDHETGERDTEKLGGLARRMPWTAGGAALAALSMAGILPTIGFVGKEKLYEAALDAPFFASLVTAVFVAANVANVYAAIAVGWRPFWAKRAAAQAPHDAAPAMVLGPLALGALGLGCGLVPALTGDWYAEAGASAVLGHPEDLKLALWHGFNFVLLLSGVTLLGGALVFALRRPLRQAQEAVAFADSIGPAAVYERLLAGMQAGAAWHTRIVQNGYLRNYLLVVAAFLVIVPGGVIALGRGFRMPAYPADVHLYEALVCLIIIAAAITITIVNSRLTAVACLGAVGYGIALIYIFFGAPDIAMTQFVVETLGVIIFVLVLYALPRFKHFTGPAERVRDWAIA